MATKRTISESKTMEMYRTALHNVRTQPRIASGMVGFGYGPAKIDEGKDLHIRTQEAIESKLRLKNAAAAAYRHLLSLQKEFTAKYTLHRMKARIVFEDSPSLMNHLLLNKPLTGSFVPWLDVVSTFYSLVLSKIELQEQLSRMLVTREELLAAKVGIAAIEKARAAYVLANAEAQNATQVKNVAFKKLDVWMREFYAVAKVALYDTPQLMEALGKKVKSK